jgi:ubiquinone/menaquinone biosynthesis C-methylase UbiE
MSVGDGEYSLRNAQHNKTGRWMLDACKVVDALLLAGPKTVLDLGSGVGGMLKVIPKETLGGLEYVGVEPNAQSRVTAGKQYGGLSNVKFVESLTWVRNHSIDFAFMLHSLPQCHDVFVTLDHLRHKLKTNGRLYIVQHNPWYDRVRVVKHLLSGYKGDPTIEHHMSCNQLRRWCEAVGYETVRCQTWGGDSIPKMRIEYLGHA